MTGFPLLLIPLAICNIVIFLMPGVTFADTLFTLRLTSGGTWAVTFGDTLLALGLLLLLLEVQRSARRGGKFIVDHLLSLLVFAGAAAEFILLPQFAHATFFLLALMALVEFIAGLSLRARRRVAAPYPAAPMVESPASVAPVAHAPAPEPEHPVVVPPAAAAPVVPIPPRVEPIVDTEAKPVQPVQPEQPASDEPPAKPTPSA
jgi:hypothetical protein